MAKRQTHTLCGGNGCLELWVKEDSEAWLGSVGMDWQCPPRALAVLD